MDPRPTLTAALFVAYTAIGAAQQPGDLDITFSSDGIATLDFAPSGNDFASALAIDAVGRIVVAGTSFDGSVFKIAVTRFMPDGSIDNSFGTGGRVTTAVGTMDDRAHAVAIQPDGKIVVAGAWLSLSGYAAVVVRYNINGSLDLSFGENGIATNEAGVLFSELYAIALQPNGRILVAGYTSNATDTDLLLMRFTTEGSLDDSFSGDGIQSMDVAADIDQAYALALQSNGFIVVAGYSHNGTDEDLLIARFSSDGTPDAGFGTDGFVTTAVTPGDDRAVAVAVQPDGKIVAGGLAAATIYWDLALARYQANGDLDDSFGGDGVITVPHGIFSGARSLALLPDGRIVTAGSSEPGTNDLNFMVAMFNADGTLDDSFSSDGIVTTDIGNYDYGNAVALQADGKIVVAGSSHSDATVNDFAVARYLSGLNVGVVEFTSQAAAPLIYPNPLAGPATLQFELMREERLSIYLTDMEGRVVETFINGALLAPGKRSLAIDLPRSIVPGPYLIVLAADNGTTVSVQVIKE